MMEGAKAAPVARPFHVLATDGGPHPASKWAALTAELIVQPRPDALPEAKAQIHNLQLRIQDVLFAVFYEVAADTSQLEMILIASQASRRVLDIASETQWAETFSAAPIRVAIEELILRNLATANDIALKVE